jgi:hypothetical protein
MTHASSARIPIRLRIHFMQQCFTLSDPAMEEALHDVPLFREFAQLTWDQPLPDESTILRFRHLMERHKLAEQMLALVCWPSDHCTWTHRKALLSALPARWHGTQPPSRAAHQGRTP